MSNSSRHVKYFLRYLVAFCVPILCIATLLLFLDYRSQIETAQTEGIGQLRQLVANIDYLEAKVSSTMLHMSGNDRFASLNTESFDPTTYTANRVFGLLRSYENSLPSGITMLYYLRGGQYIYSNGKFFSYNDFIASSDYEAALGRTNLYLLLNGIQEKTLVGLDTYGEEGAYSAALYCPVPEIDDAPRATVCFLFHRSFFQGGMEQYFPKVEALAIVTDGQQIIYNGAQPLYTSEQATELLAKNPKSGVMQLTVKGKPYVFLRERSANSVYNFGVLIPENVFYQNAGQKLAPIAALVCGMLLFSVVAALALAYSHYRSVRSVNEKMNLVSEELGARNQLIQEMVLRRLVKGTIQNGDEVVLTYNLRCAGLQFSHPYFSVIVCDWRDPTLSEEAISRTIDALGKIQDENMTLYPVQIAEDNRLAVVLNLERNYENWNEKAAAVAQAFNSQQIASCVMGMGREYESPFQIDDSYVEALVSISEGMSPLPCGIHVFSATEKTDEKSYQYPYVEYALIEQSVRNGNSEVAIDAIAHVTERIDRMSASLLIRKCLHFDLINMIIKVASLTGHPLSNIEIAQLSSWDSTDALKLQIEELLRRLAEAAKSDSDESQKSAKYALIDYVQKNFRDNGLTLEALADRFDLSYTYVSKVFREETGHNFLSYLTELRFQYVKEQLALTDKPIKEIAMDAGYYDLTNFMRKFKKTEGITPGQYRKNFLK